MLFDNLHHLLTKNIIDDVILSITKDGEPWSPREYNFTTDEGSLFFEVNHEKLAQYCYGDNAEDYNKNKLRSRDGFMWLGNREQTMLVYYLAHKSADDYTPDDYYSDQIDMLEGNGGWSEVITATVKK